MFQCLHSLFSPVIQRYSGCLRSILAIEHHFDSVVPAQGVCEEGGGGGGGAVAQPVERATPGEEVLGSIPAVAVRSLLVESVSVYYNVTG